jgi:hypothetical protein
MANPKVNDYEVVFQDVLEDKSLADGMVDLVLSFTKFIGEAQSIFTFEGILVDEVVEGKFSDFLLGRDSVVPDLRSRFGTTATFMVQTYKKIHGHVEGDPFDVIITPVGIGQNLNSTLLYSLAGETVEPEHSSFNPRKPVKFEKNEIAYGLLQSSYFQVDLESQKLIVTRDDRAKEIFDDRLQKLALLHPDALSRRLAGNEFVERMRQQFEAVRLLLPSIENAALSSEIQNVVSTNAAAIQRVASLEDAYQRSASRAKNRAVLSAIVGVAQFGLNIAGHAQRTAQMKEHQEALKQDRELLQSTFDDLKSEVTAMRLSIDEQGEAIESLVKTNKEREAFLPLFEPSTFDAVSDFYDGQHTSLSRSIDAVITLEVERTPDSFKLHYERSANPQMNPR